MENLKVFMYSCLEEDGEPHCGLTANTTMQNVLEDIGYNYLCPIHITVQEIPEMVPVLDANGDCEGYVLADLKVEDFT